MLLSWVEGSIFWKLSFWLLVITSRSSVASFLASGYWLHILIRVSLIFSWSACLIVSVRISDAYAIIEWSGDLVDDIVSGSFWTLLELIRGEVWGFEWLYAYNRCL